MRAAREAWLYRRAGVWQGTRSGRTSRDVCDEGKRSGWITHEYLGTSPRVCPGAAVKIEDEAAAGDAASIFFTSRAMYTYILFLLSFTNPRHSPLLPRVSETQFIRQLHTIDNGDAVSSFTRAYWVPSFYFWKAVLVSIAVAISPALRFIYPPPLANKPLIFRSPLATFCHYVPSAHSHN